MTCKHCAISTTRSQPGGTVVVFAPALPGLYGAFDRRIGHCRRYRRSTLATALSRAGFDVPTAHYVNAPGTFAWWLVVRQFGGTPTQGGLAGLYDRAVVPWARRIEAIAPPRFGQSVFAVGQKPGLGQYATPPSRSAATLASS